MSDIHANLSALQAVLADVFAKYHPDAFAFLGDNINYGMRPNEVINILRSLQIPIIVNLAGNHEKALLDLELNRFSTERGKELLKYTASIMSEASMNYISNELCQGAFKLDVSDKKILFVHGDLDDPFWGKLTLEKINDNRYQNYDYVFSGHTHLPHYLELYFSVNNPQLRNKKKTVFINPGSVGQPRNQNPCAQYVYMELDNNLVHFNAVHYDIKAEQELYPKSFDLFYSSRLTYGI